MHCKPLSERRSAYQDRKVISGFPRSPDVEVIGHCSRQEDNRLCRWEQYSYTKFGGGPTHDGHCGRGQSYRSVMFNVLDGSPTELQNHCRRQDFRAGIYV